MRVFRADSEHKASLPDRGEEIVPTDHALAVADEIDEQIKDLGLHRHRLDAAQQLATLSVEGKVFEKVAQAVRSSAGRHYRP